MGNERALRTLSLLALLLLSACQTTRTWYRQNQEEGAIANVRADLRDFERGYNSSPLVRSGQLQPCKYNFDQPLPAIKATDRGRYHPFRGNDGEIEYPEGEYIVLEHEIQHWMNWQGPMPWRCLDELTAYLRQRYRTEQTARRRYQSQLRMAR